MNQRDLFNRELFLQHINNKQPSIQEQLSTGMAGIIGANTGATIKASKADQERKDKQRRRGKKERFSKILKESQETEELNGMRISRKHYEVHNISDDHLDWLTKHPMVRDASGPVTLDLPDHLPPLKSALVGPVAGDSPVTDKTPGVHMANRGDGRPDSRMIHGEHRDTDKVTAVVIPDPSKEGRKWLVTTYGGDAAPREVGDPSHTPESKKEAQKFWSQHALLTGKQREMKEEKEQYSVTIGEHPKSGDLIYADPKSRMWDAIRSSTVTIQSRFAPGAPGSLVSDHKYGKHHKEDLRHMKGIEK